MGSRRVVVRFAAALLGMGGLVFLSAGTFDWPRGWIWCALTWTGLVRASIRVNRAHPDLIERRTHIGAGTPAWDVAVVLAVGIAWLAMLVVGGLDVRAGRPPLPAWSLAVGVLAHLVSYVLLRAAMVENAFFEATVRLQREEGHRVVDTGPYAIVRHPGYIAAALMALSTALLLGSARALVPVVVVVVLFAVRTLLEERFLRANLPGYVEYASRVRWRWVPGLW